LQGRFVFKTAEIFEIARQAVEPEKKKKLRNRSQNKAKVLATEEDKENNLLTVSSDSGSDCIVVEGSVLM
jgi:hypothetical protein